MKNVNFLKISLILFLLLSGFFGHAQYTTIPDLNFEKALIDLNIDSGTIDGKVLTSNVIGLTELDVTRKNINDLTGIQDFAALTKLTCSFNALTSLDLSKNTALTSLNCDNNQLTSLNATKNTALNFLSCFANKLTSLDFTENIALNGLYCSDNLLSNLNVTKNVALIYLSCFNNKLTSLNITQNSTLASLVCSNNQLTSLDVIKNTALTYLACSFNQLSSLDVSQNNALTELYCTTNQLTNLDVTKNTLLKEFTCWNNQLTNLDVSKNTSLNLFFCSNNQLTSLDVSKNTSLTSFICSNNQLTNLNLKNGKNTSLTDIDFKSNPNLTCIQVDNTSYSNANWSTFKDAAALYSNNCNATSIAPPKIKATDDQLYCPLTSIKIAPSITITHDPAEPGTEAAYIQISSGYSSGLDKIEILNPAAHPSIVQGWYPNEGKLVLSSPTGGDVLYSDLEAAIKDIVFSNSSASASGTRTFSITIGQANYLPSTKHFYLYVPSIGISWTAAKAAAEASTYYGLKGYLATLLSADEAKLSGEQASGTGWIGGSDAETEGVWKWVTGPEAGTVMSYTFWNTGEPNQQGDEDYAHITQPGIGIRGSWNDLSNTGDSSGDYQPKGYVVEYGGMPGEAPLEIAASTKITIPTVTPSPNPDPACDSGSFTFNATATAGATISWYATATGGTALATGNSFTTPVITTTTTYYVDANCASNRKPVTATVNTTPDKPIVAQSIYYNCGPGSVTITASTNIGFINWYTASTGGTSLFTGNSFKTPTISTNTTYYAEASNNGCINNTRIPIDIQIYTPPVVTDQELILCQSQTITLDAGVPGMTYKWNTANHETTQTIDVSKGGTYTVDVTSPAPESCTSQKTIIVDEREVPEISRIEVDGTRVVIYLTKEQDYFEYSVDGSYFQNSNVFYDVPGGLQTAYVREKSGCPAANPKTFVVIVFPAFFTPNNDTFNDVWEVTGMEYYPEAQVTIFDRYGKLIAQLTASKMTWDGTLDKNPLPASDYWYALKIDNTKPILRGHFSLKR
jgi:gliding motility-associated-like protein